MAPAPYLGRPLFEQLATDNDDLFILHQAFSEAMPQLYCYWWQPLPRRAPLRWSQPFTELDVSVLES